MMSIDERHAYIAQVADEVAAGTLSLGTAAKRLREDVLGLNQERFAKACKLSKRALSQLELDISNPTLATLDAVFHKFGLAISLTQLNPAQISAIKARTIKPDVHAATRLYKEAKAQTETEP